MRGQDERAEVRAVRGDRREDACGGTLRVRGAQAVVAPVRVEVGWEGEGGERVAPRGGHLEEVGVGEGGEGYVGLTVG